MSATTAIPAVYTWMDGPEERCIVIRESGHPDWIGAVYVSWPDSVRQVNGHEVRRPAGWVDGDRVEYDAPVTR